jgi:hypothetical protein
MNWGIRVLNKSFYSVCPIEICPLRPPSRASLMIRTRFNTLQDAPIIISIEVSRQQGIRSSKEIVEVAAIRAIFRGKLRETRH